MFFESVWADCIKNEIDEYSETMNKLTNNRGIILCPDCIVKKVTDVTLHSELV